MNTPVVTLTTFKTRLRGIKAYVNKSVGVFLPRCRSVHTLGLKSALTLFWVDRNYCVIQIDTAVAPKKLKRCKLAFGVFEFWSKQAPNWSLGDDCKLKGQALVESALVLPVLFLLLFGFLELSLVLQAQQKLTHVVHQAAQIGALTNNDQKIIGSLETSYAPADLKVIIENKQTDTNQVLSSQDRRYKDTLVLKVAQPYLLSIPFLAIETWDLSAQAKVRVLCQSSVTPYQCD